METKEAKVENRPDEAENTMFSAGFKDTTRKQEMNLMDDTAAASRRQEAETCK